MPRRLQTLRNASSGLREYLHQNQLPAVIESLLSSLIVMRPPHPERYIRDKILEILNGEHTVITWDVFIPKNMRPKDRILWEGITDMFFDDNDEEYANIFEPCAPELYQKAYDHYNGHLRDKSFFAWAAYYRTKKRAALEELARIEWARNYYRRQLSSKIFTRWMEWNEKRVERKRVAFTKIQRIDKLRLYRMGFVAWQQCSRESIKEKLWFKNLERERDSVDFGMLEDGKEERHSPGSDRVSKLPREAALRIFSFVAGNIDDLCRCARVCRSWKMLTQDNVLWSSLNLAPLKNYVFDKVLSNFIQKYRPSIVRINLRGCHMLTSKSLKHIGECKNIQDLNLSECQAVDEDVIRSITSNCGNLLYLNLAYCQVTDAMLRTLTKGCPNLQYLSLAYSTTFTSQGLHYFTTSKGCRKLTYADVSGCEQITPEGMKCIARGCTSLQTLVLNDLPALSNESVHALTTHCHNLRHVSFLGGTSITDDALKYLSLQSRKLQSVRLEGNASITDLSLKTMGRACPELNYVSIVDCPKLTDHALKALGGCRNIRVLNVADCLRLTDSGVRHVIEGSSGPKLREVNLTNCLRVSDVTLLRLAQRCHRLTYASFCFCEHITDAGVELLGSLTSLISLDLTGCHIGDQAIATIGQASADFKDLNIAECTQITDIGLQKLCTNCPNLESLDVSNCYNLTDGAVQTLAFCCRMLRTFRFAGCHQLTDQAIQSISGGCHYLTEIDLSGCDKITDKSLVKYLRKGCRQLRFLTMLGCRGITKIGAQKMQTQNAVIRYSADTPSMTTLEAFGIHY
ncbi:F-box and leucine-rich repeat protein 13-like [Oscarella lobularis]|uniref:F-box and leucine-rich repeat protein 13-like n=1 Tax=Oscarella lobularis TaxID=121494 RepID=UPI003313966D